MTAEHPLIFNGEMVKAILEDRKTQTRRCPVERYKNWKVGDLIWVRETWLLYNHMGTYIGNIPKQSPKDLSVGYKADGLDKENLFTWRPSIFLPKWAARIWLEITGLRDEKVQEISEADAIAEGAKKMHLDDLGQTFATHKRGFESLWDSINTKRGYGWDKNPDVKVIEFKIAEGKK